MSNKLLIWFDENLNLLKKLHTLKTMETIEWESFSEGIKSAKEEELQLIFEEVRDRVKSSGEEADSLYNKSIAIIGIAISLLTGIVGYIGTNFSLDVDIEKMAILLNMAGVGVILLLVVRKLKDNITPHNFEILGTQSKKLLTDRYYTNLQGKTPKWVMLFNLLHDYQDRFEINTPININRVKRLKDCIDLLYYIPVLTAIVWVIYGLYSLIILTFSLC